MSYQLRVVHAWTGNMAETKLNPSVQIVAQFTLQGHVCYGNYLPWTSWVQSPKADVDPEGTPKAGKRKTNTKQKG
jgi:hypothetical protein